MGREREEREKEREREREWRSREKESDRERQNKQINVRVACLLLGGDTVTTPLSSTPSESVTFPAAPSSLATHYQRPWLARSLPTEVPATRRLGVYTVVEVTSAAPMPGMQQAAFGWSPKPPERSRATCPLLLNSLVVHTLISALRKSSFERIGMVQPISIRQFMRLLTFYSATLLKKI